MKVSPTSLLKKTFIIVLLVRSLSSLTPCLIPPTQVLFLKLMLMPMVVRYQAELPSQDLSCSIKTQLLLDKDYNHPWPFYCAFLQTIRKCPEVGGRLQDSFSESPHPAATRDWIDIVLDPPREVRLRKLNSETQWIHWGRGNVSIIYLPCCPTLVFRPSDGSTRRFMRYRAQFQAENFHTRKLSCGKHSTRRLSSRKTNNSEK